MHLENSIPGSYSVVNVQTLGREFLQLIETTDMQKVYKMPILYGFYNEGDVRLAVTDAEVVENWKKFFDRGTNWKDFPKVTSYEEYRTMEYYRRRYVEN